jgi:hypothetical protein
MTHLSSDWMLIPLFSLTNVNTFCFQPNKNSRARWGFVSGRCVRWSYNTYRTRRGCCWRHGWSVLARDWKSRMASLTLWLMKSRWWTQQTSTRGGDAEMIRLWRARLIWESTRRQWRDNALTMAMTGLLEIEKRKDAPTWTLVNDGAKRLTMAYGGCRLSVRARCRQRWEVVLRY